MINNDHFHSTTDKAVILEEDYRRISELYIKEQQKNRELEMTNTHLTNECIKMNAVIMLQAEQIHKLKISTAHALRRWAQATKIWYKLKGFSGISARYENVYKRFLNVYIDLKTKTECTTKKA